MKKIIALLALTSALNCYAQLDYRVFTLFRTFPKATAFVGRVGYSIPFYKKDDIVFGYIRPSVEIQTSAVVNTGIARLDFNPISFLNFYVGKLHSNRNFNNFDQIDCETAMCKSTINRTLYGVRLALAYKQIYYISALRYFDTTLEGKFTRPYLENLGTLLHSSKQSMFTQSEHILAYKLTDTLELGYMGFFNKVRSNGTTTQMQLLFGRKKFWEEKWEAIIGVGSFRTVYKANVATVLALLTWAPENGLPIF